MQEKKFDNKLSDEELVTASTETTGAHPSQRSLWAQAELTRRLMQSIQKLEKSTSRYSDVIIVLTFVLCVIGLLQLSTTVFPMPDYMPARVVLFCLFIGMVAWTFWQGVKDWRP